jgi:FG-GAP-like repeat/Bacterial pre-peptidase C-terminal domain
MPHRRATKRASHLSFEWLEVRRLLTGHDTIATATPETLTQGVASTIPGNIDTPNSVHIYRLDLTVGQNLAADVDVQSISSSLASYLRVFDATGAPLASSNFGFGNSSVDYAAIATGVYYVGVSDSSNSSYDPNTSGSGTGFSSGQYNLTLLVNPPVSDANNDLANATAVSFIRSLPSTLTGAIALPRDADLFKLALAKGDSAQLSIDAVSIGSPLDSRLRMFDSLGNELAENRVPGSDASLTYQATATGIYYVGVSGGDNASYDPAVPQSGVDASVGSFHLDLTVNSSPPVTQEVEPNDTIDDANSIAVGASVGGTIGTAGDQDFYVFTLTSPGQLTVGATADSLSSLAPRVTLYSSNRQPLLSADGLAGGAAASIQQHLPAGTYYADVSAAASSGAGAIGDYHLSTSFIAASSPLADIPADQNSVAIAKEDLNGDGIPDLVVANEFSGDVSVLLGLGDGTFRTAVNYQADALPSAVAIGDFNHNGHQDIAVANAGSGDVSILLGNGDGTFQPAVQYAIGGQPTALAIGDFDGSGNLDIAVADADPGGGNGNVTILVGAGNGTFTVGQTIAVGVQPDAIVAARFGSGPLGDQFLDLAVANRNSDQNGTTLGPGAVSVLRGNGDGTFQAAVSYAVGDQPTSIAAGNVNGDGSVDLAVANAATQDVSLLLGQADGTFQPEQRLNITGEPAGTIAGSSFVNTVLLADFNGDHHLDLALVNSALGNSVAPRVFLAMGTGHGAFAAAQSVVVSGQPQALVAADFMGNGRLGFATANGITGAVSVRLGLGDGSFETPPRFDVGNQPSGLTAANFNDDGQLDVAVANDGSPGGISILMGRGDGTFDPQTLLSTGVATAIVSADFNGDGRSDLASTTILDPNTQQGEVTVLLGNGDGTFPTIEHIPVGLFPFALVTGDFNGDGHLDIAVVNKFSNTVSILLNDGHGNFSVADTIPVGVGPDAIYAAKISGDPFTDLIVTNSNVDQNGNTLGTGSVCVLRGNGDGTFQSPATFLPVGFDPVGIAVGDLSDGRIFIATANNGGNDSSGDVSVLIENQGGNDFSPEMRFTVGSRPTAIVAGDFNSDSRPIGNVTSAPWLDLATANSGSNSVTVLIGSGTGSFAPAVSYAIGNSPASLVATDLNGDNRMDLVCVNGQDSDISVLLGKGNGTFVTPDKFSSNAIDSTATLKDVTGDGVPDSIVLSQAGQILVRPGRATEPGAFDAARIVNPSNPARAFTIVQSAGRSLIAAVDLDFNRVSLYALDASGISTLVGRLQTDLQPTRIAATDLTGDGRQDLVVANAGSGDVSIFLATATGGFTAVAPLPATNHPAELALVNLNSDTLPEIVVSDEVAGTVTVLLNQGGGAFAAAVHYRATTGQAGFDLGGDGAATLSSLDGAGSIVAGDFTENGATDLAVVNPGDASLSFLEGDGVGGFLNPQRIVAGSRPKIVRAGHFFPDGHLDLAVLDADNHTITILRGDGHGNFQLAGQYDAGNSPNGLSIGDFDGNGISDLLVGNEFGDVMALLGNRDGTFSPFSRIGKGIAISVGGVSSTGQQFLVVSDQTRDRVVLEIGDQTSVLPGGFIAPRAVKLADLNGDGIPDLVVVNSGANNVLVYLGLQIGGFAAPVSFYAGTDPVDVQVANIDGKANHLPDLIITNQESNDVSILFNKTLPTAQNPQHLLGIVPGPRLNVGVSPVAAQLVPSAGPNGPSLLVTNSGSNNVFILPALGGGFFNDANPTIFNTGATPQAAIVGSFFGGAGLDLVTLNYSSNTLTVYRDFDPNSRQDIGSGGVGPITAIAGDFAQNGGVELVVGNNVNGALAIFAGTADGLVESDAIFNENLQHPVALALTGEGQELRLLAAEEGDEVVRVSSFESVLQPTKLAEGDLSSTGMPGFSFGLGNFAVLFSVLGAVAEAGVGDLIVEIELGANAGGASMNLPSLRDFSVDQFAAAVTRGTKWLESAVSTIEVSAGLHNLPDAAVDAIESVLNAATPQVPWQALHEFVNGLLHASAQNIKGAQKPAVADQVLDSASAERPIDSAVDSLMLDDGPQGTDDSAFEADFLAELTRAASDRDADLRGLDDAFVRRELVGSLPNSDWNCRPSLASQPTEWRTWVEGLVHESSNLQSSIGPAAAASAKHAPGHRAASAKSSMRSDFFLPEIVAASLATGISFVDSRPRDEFIGKKRPRFTSQGGGHAKRD